NLTDNGNTASKEIFPQPDDVTSITHIKGLFPYATATANQSDLMVTGYILKKYSGNLKTVSPDALSTPENISVSFKDGTVNYKIAAFPDSEKLKEASNSKSMSANGVSASGVRFFDKSFLFGAVQYKADISVNGTVVTTQTPGSGSGKFSAWPSALKNGDEIKVCGYYKYAKTDVSSDKRCQSVKANDIKEEKEYTIDSGFDALFTGGLSYNAAVNKVNNYMKTYYPDVKYSFEKSSSVSTGELDLSRSTIYSGAKVNDKDSYVIYIGN
ncbi:hypothetical protein LJC02_04545, partial [Breznakia sp. OttesenSCG-928-G09]|nr:hypothetical protein [Breznakia sp. OttesenSCG-928-G09]